MPVYGTGDVDGKPTFADQNGQPVNADGTPAPGNSAYGHPAANNPTTYNIPTTGGTSATNAGSNWTSSIFNTLANNSTSPSAHPAASTSPTTAAPAGSGPADATSPYANTHNTGGGAGAAVSGTPGFGAISDAQSFIKDPNAQNFTIQGADTYRKQLGDLANQYGSIGQQASDFGQGQANLGYNQNAEFQNNLANQTNAFTTNASGQGKYDNSLAGSGTQQQTDAYNSISNLAAGNGPSLAGKNLQAGLNSENQAIQAQAMTNQGLNGAGNTQRNLLNAQAANANNFAQAGGQASAAEQIGALGQQSSAAANLRAANQAQASASSSAGLAARSQDLSAIQGANSSSLASNQQAYNNAITAQQLGYNTQLQASAGQGNAYNNAYNTNVLQQGASANYDAAERGTGNTRAGINIEGQLSEAQQEAGATSTAGNVASGLASFGTGLAQGATDPKNSSDENIKTDIMKGAGANSNLDEILSSLLAQHVDAPSTAPGNDPGSITQLPMQQLPQLASQGAPVGGALNTSLPQKAAGKSDDGGGWGSTLKSLGGLAAVALPFILSDKRQKTDIVRGQQATSSLANLLDSL